MFNKNYIFPLKFYFFSIFLLLFQTHSFATENHNFTLFDVKLGSNISTVPNLKFIDPCKRDKSSFYCENNIVYEAYFTPKNKYDSITQYQVIFSPISKKIIFISGYTKKFSTIGECFIFIRSASKIISQRLINDNKKIIIYNTDYEFRINQVYKYNNSTENVKFDLTTKCLLMDSKNLKGAAEGDLTLEFDDFYRSVFFYPEMNNVVRQKQNEKDNKNKGKLRNF